MSEPEYLARDRSLLDLRGLAVALLRGWRFVAGLALAGAVLGAALTTTIAPTYEATTALLLARVPADDVNPTSAMTTEAEVADSLRVAGAAARRLAVAPAPPMDAEKLLRRYRVAIRTDHVLEITASGGTADEAVARAKAVASSFLVFRRAQLDRELAQATATLTERQKALEAEVASLTARINDLSRALAADTRSSDPVTVRDLESSLSRRDERNNEIATLGTRIADARLEATQASTGSRVLDPPVLPDAPVSPHLVFDVVAGVMLGLALGIGVVVTGEVVGVRARWRQDVAAAAGAPVLVEVPWARARPGRRRRRSGGGADRAALHRAAQLVGRAVASGSPATPSGTLALVSLGADRLTAELAVTAVQSAGAAGAALALADVHGGQGLLGRRCTPSTDGLDVLSLGDDHGAEGVALPHGHVIAVSNLDARAHWARLAAVADTAALVAVAGDVGEVALQGAARDLAAIGVPVRFVVLVGPDPLDQTSGRGVPADGLGPSPLLPATGERPTGATGAPGGAGGAGGPFGGGLGSGPGVGAGGGAAAPGTGPFGGRDASDGVPSPLVAVPR